MRPRSTGSRATMTTQFQVAVETYGLSYADLKSLVRSSLEYAFVPGESPYVVTADGTRYFVGGLLPTGHRIEAIDAHRVQLAKDGQRSELSF